MLYEDRGMKMESVNGKVLDSKVIESIRLLWKGGMRVVDIMKLLGVSKPTVIKYRGERE